MNVEKYFQKGYYFGHIEEFIADIDEFDSYCKYITDLSLDDETYWNCQFVVGHDDSHKDKLLPHTIPLSEKNSRQQYAKEHNLTYMSRTNTIIRNEGVDRVLNFFLEKATSFLETIYQCKYTSYHHSIHCYIHGDKLDPHTDNHNVADCAMVIYFSPDVWDDHGGLLRLTETGETCMPERGNFSLLDLTKNNPRHEITPVNGNFRRYSYLLFAKKIP